MLDANSLFSLFENGLQFPCPFTRILENYAVTTGSPSFIMLKSNGAQWRRRSAGIPHPVFSTVFGLNNYAVKTGDPGSPRTYGFDSEQIARDAADLDQPILTAICRAQNNAIFADHPSMLTICK